MSDYLLKSSELDLDEEINEISLCANEKNNIEDIEELREHNRHDIKILKITHSNLSNLKVNKQKKVKPGFARVSKFDWDRPFV